MIVTVEVALFSMREHQLCLALAERGKPSRPGLIGGPVNTAADRDAAAAALRLIQAAAGPGALFLEQLMTFAGAERDPRGWSVAVAYYALTTAAPTAGAGLRWAPVGALPALALDHGRIASVALARVRGKSTYSSLPAFLLPEQFTLPALKAAYECATGVALNDSAFRRKINELRLIEPVAARSAPSAAQKRPAQLYRLAQGRLTEFDRTI